MNLFARLRSSSRGFLVWMLLAAYACTPLAAWAQPRSQAISVPYCTARGPAKSEAPAPRSIVLRFGSHAQVAASAVPFALPATLRHDFGRAPRAGFAWTSGREPLTVAPVAWRPPPRAPPACLLRT